MFSEDISFFSDHSKDTLNKERKVKTNFYLLKTKIDNKFKLIDYTNYKNEMDEINSLIKSINELQN